MERLIGQNPPQELSKLELKRQAKEKELRSFQFVTDRLQDAINPKHVQNKIASDLKVNVDTVDARVDSCIFPSQPVTKKFINEQFKGFSYKRISKAEDLQNLSQKYGISEADLKKEEQMFFVPVFPGARADQLVVVEKRPWVYECQAGEYLSVRAYGSEKDIKDAKIEFLANKEIDRILKSASRLGGEKIPVDFDKMCFNITARIDPDCKGRTIQSIKKDIEPQISFQEEKANVFSVLCQKLGNRFPMKWLNGQTPSYFTSGKFMFCSVEKKNEMKVWFDFNFQ